MEDWVMRALKRWPNVPALYGWLKLDRRGRWLIKGELITRPQIIEVINRNYAHDERGCWYFQNGPQRGYIELERAPIILTAFGPHGRMQTHTQLLVDAIDKVFVDEGGAVWVCTEHGPGVLMDNELDWALTRMTIDRREVTETDIAATLAFSSGQATQIEIRLPTVGGEQAFAVDRLDAELAPQLLGFVLQPTVTT